MKKGFIKEERLTKMEQKLDRAGWTAMLPYLTLKKSQFNYISPMMCYLLIKLGLEWPLDGKVPYFVAQHALILSNLVLNQFYL